MILLEVFKREKNKFLFGVVFLIAVLLFIIIQQNGQDDEIPQFEQIDKSLIETIEEEPQEEIKNKIKTEIYIDLKGAVEKPGVYKMEEGERVLDIIEQAGGFTNEADKNNVNLAALLQDEQLIFIPKIGESPPVALVSQDKKESKININSATNDELQLLPGIGPSKAQEIINYREENGKFQKNEDLLEVPGIGESSLEKIKDLIVLH